MTNVDGPSSQPQNVPSGSETDEFCYDGPVRCLGVILLTLYFVTLFGALIYLQIGLWQSFTSQGKDASMAITLPWIATYKLSYDTWLLFLVLTIGALGSFVHATTSFADFVGNRQLVRSWVVWFVLRPLIGSTLAFIFYLTLRGGLFASAANPQSINVYGFAAIAAIAGLFSKQATDKLKEVFDTLFKTSTGEGDDARQNPLEGGKSSK